MAHSLRQPSLHQRLLDFQKKNAWKIYKIYFHLLTEVFLTLTEVFPCFFLSCKANARVKLAKMGHGPHSSTLVVICVVLLLFVLFYVLFVCKCLLLLCNNQQVNALTLDYGLHILILTY
jgi:hypothetical protein